MRVLVAEDDVVQLYMLEIMLRKWGHEVVTARDGFEAWHIFQSEQPPRLVILDWRMPGMDGLEVCHRIREEHSESTYVILFTMMGRNKDLTAGLRAGADDYLVKPVQKDLFRARIEVGVRVTEAKLLQQELLKAQKAASVAEFTTELVHEFHNLLVPIKGYAQLGQKHLSNDHRVYAYLRQIENTANWAANLSRKVLDMSLSTDPSPRPVDLNSLVVGMEMILSSLVVHGIDLEIVPLPGLGLVALDRSSMEQVLLNLVVNARDAMPQGGKLAIQTDNVTINEKLADQPSEVPSGEYVKLSIGDTGTGMTEDVKARIFQPFFTTKKPGSGTGLGLAICKRLIDQSGGFIRVESAPGEGTTFEVYLPRLDSDPVIEHEPANALTPGA